MKIVVLGAGSLGSLYGAWAAEAGHEVCLVARPTHVEAIERNGLTIIESDGATRTVDLRAVDDARDAPEADVVVVASKAPDTSSLIDRYRGEPAGAWSIQNGVRQASCLVPRFGSAVVGCSSMVGATLVEPGVVHHTFSGVTYLGAIRSSSPVAVRLAMDSLGAAAGGERRDDIDSVLWSKAVLAAAAHGTSIVLRVPYHRVFLNPSSRLLFMQIVGDAAKVALAEGANLIDLPGPLQVGSLASAPLEVALDRLAEIGRAMVERGQTEIRVSMLQSLESNRQLESQAVFGDLVDIADTHQLEVPVLRAIANTADALDRYIAEEWE